MLSLHLPLYRQSKTTWEKDDGDNAVSYHYMLAAVRDPRVLPSTTEYLLKHSSPFENFALHNGGLYAAVEAGNLRVASLLVQKAMDGSWGVTKLYKDVLTTANGTLSILPQARSVLKKASHFSDLTPLHLACINPNADILAQLLAIGGSANELDRNGRTLLHFAASCVTADNLRFLLSQGANVLAEDKNGVSPLEVAVKYNRAQSLEVLIDALNKKLISTASASAIPPDKKGKDGYEEDDSGEADETLPAKKKRGKSNQPVTLVTGQYKTTAFDGTHKSKDKDGSTIMHWGARFGNASTFGVLLAAGGKPDVTNKTKQTPLMIAAVFGNAEVAALLLAHRDVNVDNTNVRGFTALHFAAKNGNFGVCQMLLRHGANPDALDSSGHTPAHFAAAYGWVSILQLLRSYDADFSLCSHWKTSVLSIAVIKGTSSCLSYLLTTGGSDVNLVDAKGMSLLHHICTCISDNSLEYVVKLIKHGVNVNAMDLEGTTPLLGLINSSATKWEHKDFVAIATALINAGADANQACAKGNKPLMSLIKISSKCTATAVTVATALISGKADINQGDVNGISPLMAAFKAQTPPLIWLLINRNATISGMTCDTRETLLHHWFTLAPDVGEYWAAFSSRPGDDFRSMLKAVASNGQTPLLSLFMKVQVTASGMEPPQAPGVVGGLGGFGGVGLVGGASGGGGFGGGGFGGFGGGFGVGSPPHPNVTHGTKYTRHDAGKIKTLLHSCFDLRVNMNERIVSNKKPVLPVAATSDAELDGFATVALQDGPAKPSKTAQVPPEVDVECGGCTILHLVARQDANAEIVGFLLQQGADATIQDDEGRTPFYIAVQSNALANARLLMAAAPATVTVSATATQESPLMIAIGLNCSDFLKLLLDNEIQQKALDHRDLAGRTALYHAVALNREQIVIQLLSLSANPSLPNIRSGVTPLMRALLHSKTDSNATFEVERALVKAGADVDAIDRAGRSLMHYAFAPGGPRSSGGYEEDDSGEADDTASAQPQDQDAAIESVSNICSLIPGIEVGIPDLEASTPLILAAKQGAVISARFLLQRGANPNIVDAQGNSPLAHALINNHSSFALMLIDNGVQVRQETVVRPPPSFVQPQHTYIPHMGTYGYTIHGKAPQALLMTLPPGWEAWQDPQSGRTYYQNNGTQATQWDLPGAGALPPSAQSRISCFRFILERGFLGLAYLLLDKRDGMDLFTAFGDALAAGKYQMALGLLSKSETQVKTTDGQNLFHSLAQFSPTKDCDIFHSKFAASIADEMVIKYGLDPFLVDAHGNTPLHLATTWRSFSFIRWLKMHSARTGDTWPPLLLQRNKLGLLPFHCAFQSDPAEPSGKQTG
jgi:ankyrin repeat protein